MSQSLALVLLFLLFLCSPFTSRPSSYTWLVTVCTAGTRHLPVLSWCYPSLLLSFGVSFQYCFVSFLYSEECSGCQIQTHKLQELPFSCAFLTALNSLFKLLYSFFKFSFHPTAYVISWLAFMLLCSIGKLQ